MQNIWSSCVSCTSFPSTLPAMHRIVSCVHVNVPEEACEEVVITTIAGFLLLGWDDSDEWRTTNTLFTRIINLTNWGWLAPPSASVIVSCWSSSMIYERLLFERTMNQFMSPLNQRLTVGRSNAASGHFSENLRISNGDAWCFYGKSPLDAFERKQKDNDQIYSIIRLWCGFPDNDRKRVWASSSVTITEQNSRSVPFVRANIVASEVTLPG